MPEPATDAFDQMLKTPRFYHIAASGGLKSQDGLSLCLGGEGFRKLFRGIRDLAKDADAVRELTKGCTQSVLREAGRLQMDQQCDEAAGAAYTGRFKLSATMEEIRQHHEVILKELGPNGGDQTIVSDMVMTYAGACPARVMPGQWLKPDGAVFDPLADLSKAASVAK